MIVINPGSGPVPGKPTRKNANANIMQFVADLKDGGYAKYVAAYVDHRPAEVDGRWLYVINADGVEHEIEMPGLPIEQVRYMGKPQNIWDFPRLYVDGSSWVWCYALSNCAEEG